MNYNHEHIDNSKEEITDKLDIIYISILVFVAFLLRLYQINAQSVWFDEYVVIGNVKTCGIKDFLSLLYINSPDYGISPASAVILYYWIHLFMNFEWIWRLLPIAIGVFSILLTYFFAKTVAGRNVAFLSCLIFALSPFNIWFHQELKCYAFLQFLSLLSFFALMNFMFSKKKLLIWLMIGTTANILLPWLHATYILVPAFQVLIVFLFIKKVDFKNMAIWSVQCVVSAVIWVVWFISLSPFLFNVMDDTKGKQQSIFKFIIPFFGSDSVGLSDDLLPVWRTNSLESVSPIWKTILCYISLADYFIVIFFLLLFVFLIIYVLYINFRKEKVKNEKLFLIYSFIIPILIFFILAWGTQKNLFHPLYFFYALPFLYILSSISVLGLKLRLVKIFLILTFIFAYSYEAVSLISFKNRTDYKSAIHFIEQNAGLNDTVFGQRIVTFWDIGKIYMSRRDLNYKSFYSLYGGFNDIKREIKNNGKNRVWLMIEPFTLQFIYHGDPVDKITKALTLEGYDVYWKVFPGHYNLYVAQIKKQREVNDMVNTQELLNPDLNYEYLLKEFSIYSDNEKENQQNIEILKKYLSTWPLTPWINLFVLGAMVKDSQYFIADKICDYMISKYPNFADVYLIKGFSYYLEGDKNEGKKYINIAFNKKPLLKQFIQPLLEIYEEKYLLKENKYTNFKIIKRSLFPIGDIVIYFSLKFGENNI